MESPGSSSSSTSSSRNGSFTFSSPSPHSETNSSSSSSSGSGSGSGSGVTSRNGSSGGIGAAPSPFKRKSILVSSSSFSSDSAASGPSASFASSPTPASSSPSLSGAGGNASQRKVTLSDAPTKRHSMVAFTDDTHEDYTSSAASASLTPSSPLPSAPSSAPASAITPALALQRKASMNELLMRTHANNMTPLTKSNSGGTSGTGNSGSGSAHHAHDLQSGSEKTSAHPPARLLNRFLSQNDLASRHIPGSNESYGDDDLHFRGGADDDDDDDDDDDEDDDDDDDDEDDDDDDEDDSDEDDDDDDDDDESNLHGVYAAEHLYETEFNGDDDEVIQTVDHFSSLDALDKTDGFLGTKAAEKARRSSYMSTTSTGTSELRNQNHSRNPRNRASSYELDYNGGSDANLNESSSLTVPDQKTGTGVVMKKGRNSSFGESTAGSRKPDASILPPPQTLLDTSETMEGEDTLGNTMHLVMACSNFINETSLSKGRSHTASGTSTQGMRRSLSLRGNRPAGLSSTSLTDMSFAPFDYADPSGNFYRKYFVGKEHETYAGIDPVLGPVVISIINDGTDKANSKQNYKVVARSPDQPDIRTICSVPLSSATSLTKKAISKYVVTTVVPNVDFSKLRLISGPKLSEQLLLVDEQLFVQQYKFGVLYCKAGQSTEDEMYNNETAGPAFEEFLEQLGDTIPLLNHTKFRAGLDVKNQTTGQHSVYTEFKDCEIMFHISTMLPFNPKDPQQLQRKRHIGNDIVTIVFLEPGAKPFSPKVVRSHFQHVFLVVQAINPNTPNTEYAVAAVRFEDVPKFGPPLPKSGTFPKGTRFREFLLTKLINAENAAYQSSKFAAMNKRTKLLLLTEIVKTFTVADPVPSPTSAAGGSGFMEETGKLFRSKSARFARSVLRIGKSGSPAPLASSGSMTNASSTSSLNTIGSPTSVKSKQPVVHNYLVKLKDSKQDAFINATFSISTETMVLANAVTQETLFSWPTVSTSGWVSIPLGVKVFYGKGGIQTLQTTDADIVVKQLETCLAKAMAAAKDNPDSVSSWYAKKKKKKSDKSKEERAKEKEEKKKAKLEAKERKKLEKQAAKAASAAANSAKTMRKSSSGTLMGARTLKLTGATTDDSHSGTSTPTHTLDSAPLSPALSLDNLSSEPSASSLQSTGSNQGSPFTFNARMARDNAPSNASSKSLRSLLKVNKDEKKEREREEKERKERDKRDKEEKDSVETHGFGNPFARMGSRIAARRSSRSNSNNLIPLSDSTNTGSAPNLTFISNSPSVSSMGGYSYSDSPKSPRSPTTVAAAAASSFSGTSDDELSALRIKNQWLNDRLERTTHENAYLVAEKDYLQTQVKQLEDAKADLERQLEAAKRLLSSHGLVLQVGPSANVDSGLGSSYGGSTTSISSLKSMSSVAGSSVTSVSSTGTVTTFAAAAAAAASSSSANPSPSALSSTSSFAAAIKPEFDSIQAKFDAMYDEFKRSNSLKK